MAQFDADLQLIATTQRNFVGKESEAYDDISQELTEYIAAPELFKKERIDIQSGEQNQWQIRVATEGNSTMTKPYASESTAEAVTQIQATSPWRHMMESYKIDERNLNANRAPARLVNLIKEKRWGSKLDTAALLERQFWGVPADADDDLSLWGVRYHIVSNATLGFNGGAPFGTTVYGKTIASYPGLYNYTGTYKAITDEDLILKVVNAQENCNFMPPVQYQALNGKVRRAMYTTQANMRKLEKLQRQQNDNIGANLGSAFGEVTINRVPVRRVPYFDGAGWTATSGPTAPLYGIDWGVMKIAFMSGEVFKEMPPYRDPDSYRVIVTKTYATCQINNTNRRRHFVFYYA